MRHRHGRAPGWSAPPTDEQLHLHLSCIVESSGDSLRAVRTDLRALLERWQIEPRVANAVVDVAHELLANAHQHGAPPVRLEVSAGLEDVRVEVHDASPQPVRMLPYRPGVSEHGLGLHLVRQLSTQWGQTVADDGKAVWALFSRAPRGFA